MNFNERCAYVTDNLDKPEVYVRLTDWLRGLRAEFYAMPGNSAGGLLHVVLDDSNLERMFVESALVNARLGKDPESKTVAFCELLLRLTWQQKLDAFADCPCGCGAYLRAMPTPDGEL
jgi:hypothetical protein